MSLPSGTVTPRIGIDLVPLARVAELLNPDTGPALHRMLSPGELAASRTPDGAADPESIAGRLAAKEAVFKVFSAAGQTLPWLGIEILPGPGGRPDLRLSGRAAELAERVGLGPIDVSISHSGGFAVAVAAAAVAGLPDPAPAPRHP
ncbi:holo-ACP synthase [Streptomyces sp. NPDC002514]|uniref:holo-ACP synthase n=1 Tax=Streptomyces sp. NPDC001270 TaxID=3364554 RepID=UPI0036B99894